MVFGEVIEGFEVVDFIENVKVGKADAPVEKVVISNCGEY